MVCFDTRAADRLVDPIVERLQRRVRGDARPKDCGAAAPSEASDPVQRKLEGGRADAGQLGGDVLGDRPLDLADEAQGDVELVLVLPAGAVQPLHQVEQPAANVGGRADRDEQAVHVPVLPGEACRPKSGFP